MHESCCMQLCPSADCDDGSCLVVSWAYFPEDDTITCDELMPTAEETMPDANEVCDGIEVIHGGDGPFDYPFGCPQSYTCPRKYLIRSLAGDTLLQDTLIITVLDSVPPSFFYPTETEIQINELIGETLPAGEAFVVDNCDVGLVNDEDYEISEIITAQGIGTYLLERIYTAQDACGNIGTFHQAITWVQSIQGCTDPSACNYDETSTESDGSCVYPEEGLDCEGNCLIDLDGDGICDPELTGCIDEAACNYDSIATRMMDLASIALAMRIQALALDS